MAVGGAERTLAVYNALREHLPLAALAANAPVPRGRDTGLASVRPKISESYRARGCRRRSEAGASWRASSVGARPRAGCRGRALVVGASAALSPRHAGVARPGRADHAGRRGGDRRGHSSSGGLAGRASRRWRGRGDPVPTWRIEENRWAACRHGVEAARGPPHRGAPAGPREPACADRRLEPEAGRLGRRTPSSTPASWWREMARCGSASGVCAEAGAWPWLAEWFATPGSRRRRGKGARWRRCPRRGAHQRVALRALAGPPGARPRARRVPVLRTVGRRGPTARAVLLLRASLRRSARSGRALGMGSVAAGIARRAGGVFERRSRRARRAKRFGPARRDGPGATGHRRSGRRPVALALRRAPRRRGPDDRVHDPPLRVSAKGGRSPFLGAARASAARPRRRS